MVDLINFNITYALRHYINLEDTKEEMKIIYKHYHLDYKEIDKRYRVRRDKVLKRTRENLSKATNCSTIKQYKSKIRFLENCC